MKLNVEKLKSNQIPIGKNGLVVDNTRVPIKEKVKPIPLNQEQQQNFKLYGSLNKPEVKQTYLSQAIQNNDTIQATPEVAQEYTTNYKKFYPQFNK